MHFSLSDQGANRRTAWTRQMEKAGNGTAVPDELMLALGGSMQLHKHVSAVTNFGGIQAHARTHSAIVAVFESRVLTSARFDQHSVPSGGQTLRTFGCKRNPALIG